MFAEFKPRYITFIAMFTAMEVVLSRFLSVNAWNLKIGFNFVPIALAAMLMGPLWAGLVAALGDFVGAILFPIGAYFPGFTATAFLTGVVLGLFLYKKQSFVRILLAVLINQLILGLLINSLWISILYGSPYMPLLYTRLIQCSILIPVQFAGIVLIWKIVLPQIKKVIG
ncbi:MAG: folate family ECF transporter S component [Lachnospiraceae bacterium]|nr:folate family ECF transporter S component [Lachnospiraceae bacterium]